jgi:hypothetical protein
LKRFDDGIGIPFVDQFASSFLEAEGLSFPLRAQPTRRQQSYQRVNDEELAAAGV